MLTYHIWDLHAYSIPYLTLTIFWAICTEQINVCIVLLAMNSSSMSVTFISYKSRRTLMRVGKPPGHWPFFPFVTVAWWRLFEACSHDYSAVHTHVLYLSSKPWLSNVITPRDEDNCVHQLLLQWNKPIHFLIITNILNLCYSQMCDAWSLQWQPISSLSSPGWFRWRCIVQVNLDQCVWRLWEAGVRSLCSPSQTPIHNLPSIWIPNAMLGFRVNNSSSFYISSIKVK